MLLPIQQALPPTEPQAAIIVTARALPDPAAERAFDVRALGRAQLTDSPSQRLDGILGEIAGLKLFRGARIPPAAIQRARA